MDDVAAPKVPGRRVAIGLAVLAAVGLVGGYGVAMRSRPKPATVDLSASGPRDKETGRKIFVHVGGAVRTPGLYELPMGARVDDAVRAAGGVLEDADVNGLNLAARVKDGEKVLVPTQSGQGEAPAASGSGGAEGGLINLNTATVGDLEQLPGIGPALAQRILDYRERNGGFRSVDDLLEVPGIGAKKFEELREHVTV